MPKHTMPKDQIKQILISILIGAIVAFLSSLFDSLLTFLRDYGNNLAGGAVATAKYLIHTLRG